MFKFIREIYNFIVRCIRQEKAFMLVHVLNLSSIIELVVIYFYCNFKELILTITTPRGVEHMVEIQYIVLCVLILDFIVILFIYNKRYKIVYIILNKIYSKFYFYDEVTKRKDIDKICSEQKEGDLLTEVEKERLITKDYLRNKKDLEKAIKQLYKSKL